MLFSPRRSAPSRIRGDGSTVSTRSPRFVSSLLCGELSLMTQSEELFARAQRLIPGGVNSPVRAFKAVGGTPLFIRNAEGARVWDVDGRSYIDYVGSWGPMILGHAYPPVVEAVQR